MDGGESSRKGEAFFGNEGDWSWTTQAPDWVGSDGGGVDQAQFYDEVGGFDWSDEMGAGLAVVSHPRIPNSVYSEDAMFV